MVRALQKMYYTSNFPELLHGKLLNVFNYTRGDNDMEINQCGERSLIIISLRCIASYQSVFNDSFLVRNIKKALSFR